MHSRRFLMVLTVVMTAVLVLGADPAAAKDDKKAAPAHALRITLKGQVYEAQPPFQLFGPAAGASLSDLTAAIGKAATDPKVGSLVLRLDGAAMGWTQRQTLRRAILAFNESGKPSRCFVTSIGGTNYALASACRELSLHPTGIVEISGLAMDLMFYKGLLDKVGVRFQELRMGRYKSAVEPMTRTEPSGPVVEQMNSLLDELYAEFCDAIAENRGMKQVEVRGIVDVALFNAKEAKAAGLIDHVEFEDQFLARVRGGSKAKIVEAKLGKSLEMQAGGFAGMMQVFNQLFGGPKKKTTSKKPKIVVIHGTGAITESAAGGLFGGAGMTSRQLVPIFRKVREDDTVKAVVFRVNSPGGSALASDLIGREVQLTAKKKPVVVSMGDVAASGGYYVSCHANWIVAERGTITGSIGVIGAVPDMTELYEHLGLTFRRFSRGKRAGLATPGGTLTEDGRELMMKFMREVYDDFLTHVATGRKLKKEAVASIAEGRVWTGSQAHGLGLVDEIGGLDAAMAKARLLGSVPEDAEIVTLPKAKTLFDLLNELSGEGAALRAFTKTLPAEVQAGLRKLEWVGCLRRERVLTVWPEVVEIR
ncbi:MAG: signal peptide peptidase SppA [Planctomycetota bacterium]